MDDCVLLHHDKAYLKKCLQHMQEYLNSSLGLEFNNKTQIRPFRNGVDYLGFHFYLTESGKILRKVKCQTKRKYKRRLKFLRAAYADGLMGLDDIQQVLYSYKAHLSHGHCYRLQKSVLSDFALRQISHA